MFNMQWIAVEAIKPNVRNARAHSKKQIRQIADSITAFGFLVPILIDQGGLIIAGHGRYAAAALLGLQEVPVIRVEGLSDAKRRALALADNKIAENAGWDRELLATELPELADILIVEGLDVSITGFAPVEIDQIATDFEEDPSDPADTVDPEWTKGPPLTTPGDLWQLGHHRLLCGDARNADDLGRLMGESRAAMVFLDPPYNVRVRDIVGRGQIKHSEFAMASGELSRAGFVEFLKQSLAAVAGVSRDGAVHFVCMDWRHLGELLEAGGTVYDQMLNLVVWAKTNAGQGSFYRSAHELIGVYRVGTAAHLNNVELGRHGRSRSNVWHYAGVNTFRAGRLDELKCHPTVKPVALVADAIKDCTRRGDIVRRALCAEEEFMSKQTRPPSQPNGSHSAVGYCKPPVHTRFKKGQSGNPKGRRKGQRNVHTVVGEVLSQRIKIREGNRTRTLTKLDALILTMVTAALKGDAKAQASLIALLRLLGMTGEPPQTPTQEPFTADDQGLIADYFRRNGSTLQQPTDSDGRETSAGSTQEQKTKS